MRLRRLFLRAARCGKGPYAERGAVPQPRVAGWARPGTLAGMRRPELRNPLARAVVPVLAGIAFFGVLALFLWGVASYLSANSDEVDLAPTTADIGSTTTYAKVIAEDGPIILPDLLRANGRRTIVLDHTGSDPQYGWHIYMAYPADRDVGCKVDQIDRTRTFTDCEQRSIPVEALALPPQGVRPIVYPNGTLTLDLLPDSGETGATSPVTATVTTS